MLFFSSKQGKKRKNKKRKSKNKDENISDNSEGNSSPVKRLKLDDTKDFEKNSGVEKDKRSNKVDSSTPKVGIDLKRIENIDSPAQIENEEESKKRRKKRKRSKSTGNDSTLRLDTSATGEVSSVNGNVSPVKIVTDGNETVNGDLAKVTNEGSTVTPETPKSKKKHKKRKSSEIGVRNGDDDPLKLAVLQDNTKEKESNSLDMSQEEKVETNGLEIVEGVLSPRNKKNRKRKSVEMQEAINSAVESSDAKALDKKVAASYLQTNGALGDDDLKTGSPFREKKKSKNRNSHAPETGLEKNDKFSPRHTRSLKKF